jgi:cytochrome c2
MRRSWGVLGIGLAALVVVGFATWAAATPQAGTPFRTLYGTPKEGSALAKAMPCQVCHTAMPPAKTNLNPYAADLQKAAKGALNEAAFKAIENLDSDKDGSTNVVEIRAGTLPGDPRSKPQK